MIKRLHNYLKDQTEEFYGLDYDLKPDDAFNLEGIFVTINSCKISDLQVLQVRHLICACTKHSQGIFVLLGTRLKNIQWDGPRRDVCLHAMDFICTFLMTWGEGSGNVACNTIISCPVNTH